MFIKYHVEKENNTDDCSVGSFFVVVESTHVSSTFLWTLRLLTSYFFLFLPCFSFSFSFQLLDEWERRRRRTSECAGSNCVRTKFVRTDGACFSFNPFLCLKNKQCTCSALSASSLHYHFVMEYSLILLFFFYFFSIIQYFFQNIFSNDT